MIVLGFSPRAWLADLRDRNFVARTRRLTTEIHVLRLKIELTRATVAELAEASA